VRQWRVWGVGCAKVGCVLACAGRFMGAYGAIHGMACSPPSVQQALPKPWLSRGCGAGVLVGVGGRGSWLFGGRRGLRPPHHQAPTSPKTWASQNLMATSRPSSPPRRVLPCATCAIQRPRTLSFRGWRLEAGWVAGWWCGGVWVCA
jgi:hypothetical protein